MASYLTVDEYKTLATIPSSFVVAVETASAGFTLARLELASARIDAKLRKRYEFPVTDPTKIPIVVKGWLVAIVTPEVFLKRGISGTDEQWAEYVRAADTAVKELDQAADSEKGLFDLPKRNDGSTESGIVGGTLVYSEQGPYVQADRQAAAGRDEDASHTGTGTQ